MSLHPYHRAQSGLAWNVPWKARMRLLEVHDEERLLLIGQRVTKRDKA